MSKQLAVLIGILLLVVGVFFFVQRTYTADTSLPKNIQKSPKVEAKNALFFSPSTMAVTPGQPVQLAIRLQNSGTPAHLVQLELAYDPIYITNLSIRPGSYFTNPKVVLNTNNIRSGRLSYALEATTPANQPEGTVAIVSFIPLKSGWAKQTSLSFLPKTTVKATDGTTIFTSTTGASIMFPVYSIPTASPSAF